MFTRNFYHFFPIFFSISFPFRCVGEGGVTILEAARMGGGVGKVLRVRGPSGSCFSLVYGLVTRRLYARIYILTNTLHRSAAT